jgi:hypothetical protein
MPCYDVLNVAGVDNDARFFVDNGQYPFVNGYLHIIEQAIETVVVGLEVNRDRIIALSVVPPEEGSEFGQESGNRTRKIIPDFMEFGLISLVIDLPGIIDLCGAGYRRIGEGVDIGGAGTVSKGMQPVV